MPKLETPRFWIVAGPNGSGKTTLYDRADIEGFGGSVWIINPDTLAAHISEQEGLPLLEANGEALDRIMAWLRASIRAHHTVGVETVLSTPKYRTLVKAAKAFGFEIRLLYVTLNSADLNVERVRLRVAKGRAWRSRSQNPRTARTFVPAIALVSETRGFRIDLRQFRRLAKTSRQKAEGHG